MTEQTSIFERPTPAMDISAKQRLVLQAIQSVPEAADDDARLIATVWRMEGWNSNDLLEHNIARVTRPETICRRRRELYDMGLIEYSDKASKRRSTAYRNERDAHSNYVPGVQHIAE